MIRKILLLGDKRLRIKAEEVAPDHSVLELANDMAHTMCAAKGIGLAAPQIGEPLRIVVFDLTLFDSEPKGLHILVNPRIMSKEDPKADDIESCLSIPSVGAYVKRHSIVTVEYTDENGKLKSFDSVTGRLARVLQHEIDHLDGVLYTSYLPDFQRKSIKRKMLRYLKQVQNCEETYERG